MQFLNIWNVFFVLVLLKKCTCGDSRRDAQTNSKNKDNASGTGLKTEMSRGEDKNGPSAKLDAEKPKNTFGGHSFGENLRRHFEAMEKEGQGRKIMEQDAKFNKENPQKGSKQRKDYITCTRDDGTINKDRVEDSKDFGGAGNDLHKTYSVLITKYYSFHKYVLKMDKISAYLQTEFFENINPDLIDRNDQRDFYTVHAELKQLTVKLQNAAKNQSNERYLNAATAISDCLAVAYSFYRPPRIV